MPIVEYQLYDVFTDTPFAGNPLAVAIDPPALDTDQCRTVAAELNLSETVFLDTSDRDNGVRTRIFTPEGELPFAGHPTVGAAVALSDAGIAREVVTLLEGVGPVEVTIDDGLATLTTPAAPRSVDSADPEDVVRCLGLGLGDLHPSIGSRGWSAGLPFTIVALRDVDTLAAVTVDVGWWQQTVALTDAIHIYAVTPLEGVGGRRWRARMFSPGFGIPEDPATGSAAAAMCGFLAGHASTERLTGGWIIEQGVEMGRPSEIRLGTVLRGNELIAATVGGRAVRVGRGELTL